VYPPRENNLFYTRTELERNAMNENAPRRAQLFVTCLIETFRPEAGMAVVQTLESLGVAVEFPIGQTCCGQPAFNAGAWDDARAMGRYTLGVLAQSDAPIVVPSGSCGDMLLHHYPELFANDPRFGPLAEQIAARVFEFSQFLVDVLGVVDTQARFPERVAYHPSCHLARGMEVTQPPRALLQNARDAQLVELNDADACCGFGGLFALNMSEISSAMLERKLDALDAAQPQTVVSCDMGCLLHIGGGLHRRGSSIQIRHLAEILANADALE
jgi:L-lactate dehydrogenase complex protein LldE